MKACCRSPRPSVCWSAVFSGVVLAVVLSLFWLLAIAMRPKRRSWAVAGTARLPQRGDYPHARPDRSAALSLRRQPGFLQHRLFLRAHPAAIRTRSPRGVGGRRSEPGERRRCDGATEIRELREELARRGSPGVAGHHGSSWPIFERRWVERARDVALPSFPTMRAAVRVFEDATADGRGATGRRGPSDRRDQVEL